MNLNELEKAMEQAYKLVDKDPNLAIYVMRDFQELKDWKLDDLAWSMYQNTTTRNEVRWFLDQIKEEIEKQKAL